MSNPFLFLVLLLLVVAPQVSSESTCEAASGSETSHKHEATKLKLWALFAILVAGAVGILLPILGESFEWLKPGETIFFLIQVFAGGVILATGFIHVLPDAVESLTSSCLMKGVWEKFPWAYLLAMATAMASLSVDTLVGIYHEKQHDAKARPVGDEEEQGGHVHEHIHAVGSGSDESKAMEVIKHRIVAHVLELGIVVHSVIIGLSLGTSQDPKTIQPLIFALSFHQFFEGMGLGGCITQAKFKKVGVTVMVLFFALTTPVGIGIGMGISESYSENSPKALAAQGILNALSAGILIDMALVDLLAAAFKNPLMKKRSFGFIIGAKVSMMLGAGCMSLLAIWA